MSDLVNRRTAELEAILEELVGTFNPEPDTKNPLTIWDRAAAILRDSKSPMHAAAIEAPCAEDVK